MSRLPGLRVVGDYMAHHSRSFRFATLLMGGEDRARIERVYAWCRHTDNLVDAPSLPDGTSVEAIDASLDEWLTQSRNADESLTKDLETHWRARSKRRRGRCRTS